MPRGGGAASGVRGGGAANDETPASGGVSWHAFKQEDPGGAFVSNSTRVHCAGVDHMDTNAGGAASAFLGERVRDALIGGGAADDGAQVLFAIPQWFHIKGRITRMLMKAVINPAATNLARLGIYRNGDVDTPYPGSRVYDSGDLDCSTAGVKAGATAPSVSVDAGELMWFVAVFNVGAWAASGSTMWTVAAEYFQPILGMTLQDAFATATDRDSFGIGWRHAFAYASGVALPSTFPTSAPVVHTCAISTTNAFPALFYGWNR